MRRMMLVTAVVMVMLGGAVADHVRAQGAKAPTVPATVTMPPPELSEVETLKLQLNVTRVQAVDAQIRVLQMQGIQLDAEREALLRDIERAHPGWTIDRQTMKFVKAAEAK